MEQPGRPYAALLLCLLVALALPLLPVASAQQTQPAIAVVVTHPYPDETDPLGHPFQGNYDSHLVRHSFRVSGAMAYPHIVVDGTYALNGLPAQGNPEEGTRNWLQESMAQRTAQQSPLTLRLQVVQVNDAIDVSLAVEPKAGGALDTNPEANIWLALTEDHVYFKPPPAVSNGVYNHRFTQRALVELATANLGTSSNWTHSFALESHWKMEQLSVVAWVQVDADEPPFSSHEVLQAVTAAVNGPAVTQTARAALVEMRSATWCDTCLIGDRVVEEAAQEFGLVSDAAQAAAWRHWQSPTHPILAIIGAAIMAGIMVYRGRQE